MHNKQISLILLGKTGSGKSASGNTILNRKAFASKMSAKSTTTSMKCGNVTIGEVSFKVYDTPGLFDTERGNEAVIDQWNKDLPLEESVPTVFLLVIRADRFTEEGIKTVKDIEEFLGEGHIKNTWILFTRGDELKNEDTDIEDFIDETEELRCIVRERFEGRFHVFDNKAMENREQVTKLTKKIQERYCITKPVSEPSSSLHHLLPSDMPERRLLLLGKTGVGKSATGNTILDGKIFHSEMNTISVTCMPELQKSVVAGRQVSVVDTPGLFDTRLSNEELAVELGRSIFLSPKGFHSLLIVLRIGRHTEHEEQVIELITALYGGKALKYAMILFTGGDQLEGKTIEECIEGNSDLSDLVQQCGGRYHVLNNKDTKNREQVTTLLNKIDKMVEENGGECYTNEMFEDAIRLQVEEQMVKCINARREEEERIRKQQEEQERKRREKQEEIDRVKRETEKRIRKEYDEESARREEEERIRKQKEVQEEQRRVKQQREEEIKREEREERIKKYEEQLAALKNQLRTVGADGSPDSEKPGVENPGDGFLAFLKKYWKRLVAAAAIGTASGAAGGAVVGACIGAVLGPVGAAIGAGVGAAAGVVVGTGCGTVSTYARHKKEKKKKTQ